jgi:hypothetical protein
MRKALPSVVAHSPSSLEAGHGITFVGWATAIGTPAIRPQANAVAGTFYFVSLTLDVG